MAKWRSKPSLCPQCKVSLERKSKILIAHYRVEHGRMPTDGEKRQFINYLDTPTPYSEGEFKKPRREVCGGAVSPR